MSARTSTGTVALWAAVLSFAPSSASALQALRLRAAGSPALPASGAIGSGQASPASLLAATPASVQSGETGDEDEEDDDDDDDESDDETDQESAISAPDAAVPPLNEASPHAESRSSGSADAAAGAAASSTADEGDQLGAGAEVDAVTRYLWRGRALSSGPALEPSAWLSYGDVSVELWMNLLLRDERPAQRLSAIDPVFSYARAFRHFKVEASFTGYWQAEAAARSSTAEAGLKLSIPWGPVRIFTAHSVDIDAEPGAYFGTFGVELREKLGWLRVRAFSDLGWANARFNRSHWAGSAAARIPSSPLDTSRVDRAALDVAELGLELRCALVAGMYVQPHAEGSTLLAAPLRLVSGERMLFAAGIALGMEY